MQGMENQIEALRRETENLQEKIAESEARAATLQGESLKKTEELEALIPRVETTLRSLQACRS